MAACAGPVIGPIAGGFAAAAESWRWPIWELAWISGFSSMFLAFLLPETLPDTILLKRAQRLRKLTGNGKLRSLSEIRQAEMRASEVAREYLVRPFQLMIEPAVLFINLYVGRAYPLPLIPLISPPILTISTITMTISISTVGYAIFYLWFEAFPLVFGGIYHFTGGIAGLPFIGIVVGALFSYIFYVIYLLTYLYPKFDRLDWKAPPEEYLRLAVIAGIMIPVSLFIFGWTAREGVHWIWPIIGAGLYMPGIYLLFQSALVYLPVSYPHYVASILAGNDFFRSSVAAAFPYVLSLSSFHPLLLLKIVLTFRYVIQVVRAHILQKPRCGPRLVPPRGPRAPHDPLPLGSDALRRAAEGYVQIRRVELDVDVDVFMIFLLLPAYALN